MSTTSSISVGYQCAKLIGAASCWLLHWAMSADAASYLHTLQERSRGAVYAEPLLVAKGCRRQHG